MTRKVFVLLCALLLGAVEPLVARDPLPVPLRLPPGGTQILPIDREGSYMGDAVRIVDCPADQDNPFGVCGNLLFGGMALWNSHLSGAIQIKFYPPLNDISHFEVTHPFNLIGEDVFARTPQLYQLAAFDNAILDTFDEVSSGDLNLRTGEVTNFRYKVIFFNTWYALFGRANPAIKPPPFEFPGIYGSTNGHSALGSTPGLDLVFEQRPDGLLDFTFYGSTFLPLGNNVNGDPVRLPMPFCGPFTECASIQVPGMSLHPHLRITTKKPPNDPPCGDSCIDVPFNTVQEFTLNSRFSSIGDDFNLNIPQLGGEAIGRSQMQGRMQIQFGAQNGDFVPLSFALLPPAGMIVPPPPFPLRGLYLGILGHDEKIRFPRLTYDQVSIALLDDPFDIPVGELNIKTGQLVGGLRWRSFWASEVLTTILVQNQGRIPPQSFQLGGPASFNKGPNGEWIFRHNAIELRPFDTFLFPSPDLNPATAMVAGPGSLLTPFYRMQAALPTDTPGSQVISGSQSNVLGSFGDRFSYNYSIPCEPAGKPSSFEYTNTNPTKGGTFRMEGLASVACINSRTSNQPRGAYDTVTFSGFGTWSKDDERHIATVQISIAPDAPYVTILIDGGTVSNVNTKPVEHPVP
jgi:hypothetical protein